MKIRKEFSETEIKKSGHNTFQHFRYLELSDFVPLAIKLCQQHGLYTHMDIGVQLNGHPEDAYYAVMTILNTEDPEETLQYKLRIPELNQLEYNGALKEMAPISATKQIQDTGKMETYIRRYLYMLFLDLAVPDSIDAGKPPRKQPTKKPVQKQQQKQEAQTKVVAEPVEPRHRPRDANDDLQIKDPAPMKTLCNQCIAQLQKEGKEITKPNMRVKATIAKRDGRLDAETHSQLLKYIDEYCPEESN